MPTDFDLVPVDHNPFASQLGKPYAFQVAANFKPIDPLNPSYTNPGGYEKVPVVENPGRATKRPWTTKEIESVRKGEKPEGRSDKSIEHARSRLGLSEKYKPLTEEDINTLREAGPHLSAKELARMLDRTPDSVAQALTRLGVTKSGFTLKPVDHDPFEKEK